jgi:hypothetical protein
VLPATLPAAIRGALPPGARRRLTALVAASLLLLAVDAARGPAAGARCVAEVVETDAASGRVVLRVAPACLAAGADAARERGAARCETVRAIVEGVAALIVE